MAATAKGCTNRGNNKHSQSKRKTAKAAGSSWDGFTTRDLARCQIMARFIALIYNWWNLFVRLAEPDRHLEAITSRPLLLSAIAERSRHARQTTLRSLSTKFMKDYKVA